MVLAYAIGHNVFQPKLLWDPLFAIIFNLDVKKFIPSPIKKYIQYSNILKITIQEVSK